MPLTEDFVKEQQTQAKELINHNDKRGFGRLVFGLVSKLSSYRRHQGDVLGQAEALINSEPAPDSPRKINGALPIYSAINSRPSLVANYEKGEEVAIAPTDHIRITGREEYHQMRGASKLASQIFEKMPVAIRAKIFEKLWAKIEQNKELMKFLISANVGKSLDNAEGEMKKAKESFDFVQEEYIQNELMPTISYIDAKGKNHTAKSPDEVPGDAKQLRLSGIKQAKGVVGVITSYNYPLALSVVGIMQSLLAGNGVMFKASKNCPHWSFLFKDLFEEAFVETIKEEKHSNWFSRFTRANAGLLGANPVEKIIEAGRNLFQVVIGNENDLYKDVDLLYFVGSTAQGQKFSKERAAMGKPTISEEGGNSAVALMSSFIFDENGERRPDIMVEGKMKSQMDIMLDKVFKGNVDNSGQRCTKASLLYVDEKIHDEVIAGLRQRYLNAMGVGNPMEKSIGALVDEPAYETMLENMSRAREILTRHGIDASEAIVWNGNVNNNVAPHGGIYVYPAVIDWTKIDWDRLSDEDRQEIEEIISKETFAPLLHVVKKVKNAREAGELSYKHDSEKLSAAIFTQKVPEEYDEFKECTGIKNVALNEAPKDQAPYGEHGNARNEKHSGEAKGFRYYFDIVKTALGAESAYVGTPDELKSVWDNIKAVFGNPSAALSR